MLKLNIITLTLAITAMLSLPACSSVSQSVKSIQNNDGPTVVFYQYDEYRKNHENPVPLFHDDLTATLTGTIMSNQISDNSPSFVVDNDSLVVRMTQPNELNIEKLIFWYDQHTRRDLEQMKPGAPCSVEFTSEKSFISIKPAQP